MVEGEWPWLRKHPKVLGLGVVIGGGNEAMPEQVGNLLGRRTAGEEPRGKGMTQAMGAKPANKPAAAVGPIHSRSDCPGRQ